MTATNPLITLNNGVRIPALGFGVLGRENRELTQGAVEAALAAGYRLIDTAAAYNNERDVGRGIASSGIPRSDVFVTTKLWLADFGYENALRAFDVSRKKLGLDYIDLYLLHWPVPTDFEATIQSYRAVEKLLADGLVRAIGVSNFSPANLKTLMDRVEVAPAANQIELHPFFAQRELREAHSRLGILTQAWSPLGGSVRRASQPEKSDPLGHPIIAALAQKYGKTPAQIVLRWHLEHGFSAIPKSFRPERIKENFGAFDFALSNEDVRAVDSLDTGMRSGPDPEVFHAGTFPIKVEE
jgi:diketogulonate reductase-like aldo/keto reductase